MPLDIRAVIYARVSTDLQEREQTVLIQLEALRTYLNPNPPMDGVWEAC